MSVNVDAGSWIGLSKENKFSGPSFFAFVLVVVESLLMYSCLPETLDFAHISKKEEAHVFISPFAKSTRILRTPTTAKKLKIEQETSPAKSLILKNVNELKSGIQTLSLIHFLFLLCFSGIEFTLTFLTFDKLIKI